MITFKGIDTVSIPLHIEKYPGTNYCCFCKINITSCHTVRTNIGTHIICSHCKEKIENHYSLKPERETVINNRNILSGGLPYTNRHKY